MPKIKLAIIQGNKGKVLMKFDTPYKERGPLFQINTKKFVRLMTENPEDRDFYLEDQNLTYDQLLIMVVLKIPFTSITPERKDGRNATSEYKCEIVSPICNYEDIETIQEIVRQLRHKGAIANASCGIHVHINARPHTARSLRNITNIMASKEDLLFKALYLGVHQPKSIQKLQARLHKRNRPGKNIRGAHERNNG